jgi:hypothetical protein
LVDLLGDQPRQVERALRVADQHEAASAVVVPQVLAPRSAHVAVRVRGPCDRDGVAEQPGERDLAVDGRVDAAVARKARGLVERDRAQLGVDRAIGLERLLVADRRIGVEAVDPPRPRALHPLDPELLADGREPRRVQARAARVAAQAGLAQPDRLRLGGRRRREGGGDQQREQDAERRGHRATVVASAAG